MAFDGTQILDPFGAAALAQKNISVDPSIFAQQVDLQDPAWTYAAIDEVRWNQQFPYQLVFLNRQGSQYVPFNGAVFTLPIPPEELQRTMPFAITTTVTAGGIVEEHNGAPLRPITFSGTTGLLPLRGTGNPVGPRTLGQSVFAGTLQGARGVQQNFVTATSGAQALFKTNLITQNQIQAGPLAQSTGYYQFLILQQFLEQYITLKKSKAGANVVLGLAIHKEQALYLVTPVDFTLRRSRAEPLMWNYTLSFKAWGRTIPQRGLVSQISTANVFNNKDLLTAVLTRLSAARRLAQSLKATIQGFAGDVDHTFFEPLRQTVLFCKDLLGATITAADLPATIAQSMKGAILEATGIQTSVTGARNAIFGLDQTLSAELQAARTAVTNFSVTTNKAATQAGVLQGSQTAIDSSADPANKLLDNPADNFSFFDTVVPGQLTLSPTIQAQITAERNRIKQLTRTDFATFKEQIIQFSNNYANSVGAGSIGYDEIYGLPTVNTVSRTPTTDEWTALSAMNDSILQLNYLAATATPATPIPNVMQYVAALAGPQGIEFNIPNGKFSIPFPLGSTLEMIATRYLGDPDRWIEIATLNNLAAPYVDEVGFTKLLVTNGDGLEIEIDDATNFYVGQIVYIQSNTILRTTRTIQSITQVGSNFVITVDGDPNLDIFTTSQNASISGFLPNTVNSQRLLYLPTDKTPPQSNFEGPPNEVFANLENQLAVGGADLLLTADGDLAITSQGDIRLAIGMANLVQRVKLAIDTTRGSLLHHPDYGLPQIVGQSTADLTADQLLASAKSLFKDDPAFTGVQSIAVNKTGPLVTLNVNVGVANTSDVLPISVTVPIA